MVSIAFIVTLQPLYAPLLQEPRGTDQRSLQPVCFTRAGLAAQAVQFMFIFSISAGKSVSLPVTVVSRIWHQ